MSVHEEAFMLVQGMRRLRWACASIAFVMAVGCGESGGAGDAGTDSGVIATTGVTLDRETLELAVGSGQGSTGALVAMVVPSNATHPDVTWASSNPAVATVSAAGLVSGISPGSATITVTTSEGGFTDTCLVTVTEPATGIAVTPPSQALLAGGPTATLTVTVTPAGASQVVTWTSSNASVATVSATGVVTPVAAGSAIITATTAGGAYSDTSDITVSIAPVSGVALNPSTLSKTTAEAPSQLTATVMPAYAGNQAVTWATSDSNVAIVSATGEVQATGEGTATITVTTVEGPYTDQCIVTVTPALVPIFYVDPANGDDSNTGASEALAFRTIERAQAAVRTVNGAMSEDVVVHLRGGVYALTNTVSFTSADSGTNGYDVIWKAYDGETPVITSAQTLTGWTAVGNGQYQASVGSLYFRQMYVNGARAVVARYPDQGSYLQLKAVDKPNQTLGVVASAVSNWGHFTDVEMVVQLQWSENYLPLASYAVANGVANISIRQSVADVLFPRPYPILAPGSPLYFENAHEFLNQPGELYVNAATQTVYYLPRPGETMSSATVTVPTLETLFSITGGSVSDPVHDVRFSNLTFADTTWTRPSTDGMLNAQGGNYNLSATATNQQYVNRPPAGVYAAYADRITFSGNTFTRMGSTALDLHHGVHDSSVVGNLIYDVSGNGMMVGKFSDPSVEYHSAYNPPTSPAGESLLEVVTNVDISNNLVTRTGQDYAGTAAINAGYVNSTTITHNDISDVPWAGISLGWGWQSVANALGNNQVSYNHISNVMNVLCDAGGIYHLSNDPGTTITGNYIHEVVRTPTACASAIAGIYLDEGSNNLSVTDNVLGNTGELIRQNVNGPAVVLTGNVTANPAVMTAAGLQAPYTELTGRINLAFGKPTSASTIYSAAEASSAANDNDPATGWSAAFPDPTAWWQVDLGSEFQLSQFTLTTRQNLDQPEARNNFEVRASNDPTFATYAVLGRQDSRGLTHTARLTAKIYNRQPFRYVRVAKTDGQYFFLADFSVVAGSGTMPPATVPTFANAYYTIVNVNSGKALDVAYNSTADGGAIDQWTVNGGNNQQWQILPVSSDLFRIMSRHSGKALDVGNYSHDQGGMIDQWTWNGGNNQLWYFEVAPDGYWVIRSFESRQVLDVYGASTSDGATVTQWTPTSQTNQEWNIQ